MACAWLTGSTLRIQRGKIQLTHQTLPPLVIDSVAACLEVGTQPTPPVKRPGPGELIEPAHQIFLRCARARLGRTGARASGASEPGG